MTTKQLAEYLTAQLGGTFRITDDVQLYNNKWLKRQGADFTPGIVRRLLDAPPVYNYGTYATVYRLEMQGDRDKRREIEQDISDFIASKHSQAESIGDYKFIGAYRHPIPSDFEPKGDGSGGDVFKITVDFELWVVLAGITGSQTELYIDDVKVPFVEIVHETNKGVVSSLQDNHADEIAEFTGKGLRVALPIVDNVKILDLLNAIKNDKVNSRHKIRHKFADWYEIENDYYLKSGNIRTPNNTDGLSFALDFVRAFPRKQFGIRVKGDLGWQELSLLSYSYNISASHNTTIKGGYTGVFGQMVNHPLQTGYNIEITAAIKEIKSKIPIMYEAITNNNSNVVYELLDGDIEYTVIMNSASISFEETPDIAIRIVFVEADIG